MNDEEFSTILNAIYNSKTFKTTLQNLSYSNNYFGPLSMKCIGRFLQNFNDYSCLKELNLSNAKVKGSVDLRILT